MFKLKQKMKKIESPKKIRNKVKKIWRKKKWRRRTGSYAGVYVNENLELRMWIVELLMVNLNLNFLANTRVYTRRWRYTWKAISRFCCVERETILHFQPYKIVYSCHLNYFRRYEDSSFLSLLFSCHSLCFCLLYRFLSLSPSVSCFLLFFPFPFSSPFPFGFELEWIPLMLRRLHFEETIQRHISFNRLLFVSFQKCFVPHSVCVYVICNVYMVLLTWIKRYTRIESRTHTYRHKTKGQKPMQRKKGKPKQNVTKQKWMKKKRKITEKNNNRWTKYVKQN